MWDIFDRLKREEGGLELEELALPLMRYHGAFRDAVRKVRAAPDAGVVHAQYGALVSVMALLRRDCAHIVSLRGSDSYWRFGTLRNRVGGLARVLMSWIGCLGSDAIIVMSNRMTSRVRRWPGLARRPILCIPDPAGDIFWPPAALEISRELLSQPFVVAIASLQHDNPIKRTWLVSSAADLCQRAGMSLELKVLSGISREQVRSELSDVHSIALASTHEGWPNIIKEGLLLGANFVATSVGDLPEYAGKGSGNRIVAPHPIEFACAWIDQIAAKVLSPHGIAESLAAFHPDVVALKMKLLYLALVEEEI